MKAKQSLSEPDDFSKKIHQVRQLNELEERISQERSTSRVTNEELIERAHEEFGWSKEHAKYLMSIKKKPVRLLEDEASVENSDKNNNILEEDTETETYE